MNYTTNYNLNKPEGTDLYNHLTVDNPNMDTIDAAIHANKLQAIGDATELVSGTIHAITRSDGDQNIFRFKATGDFHAGDTITVDGVTVNAYTTAGQQLTEEAYVLSAEVICILDNTSLWVLSNKVPNVKDALDWDLIATNNTPGTPTTVDITSYKEIRLVMIEPLQSLIVGDTICSVSEAQSYTVNYYFDFMGDAGFVRLSNNGTKLATGTAGYTAALYAR